MYSPERIAGLPPAPAHKPEEFVIPEDEDDDPIPEEPGRAPVAAPRPRPVAAATAISAADQVALTFWSSLNEAEQKWLTGGGEAPRKLLKWASRLETSPKILKIRTYTGEGADRKLASTFPVRYVEVADQDVVVAFTLAMDSLPPEYDFGAKLELEFDGTTKRVLAGLSDAGEKFPFPRLVFFADDGQG